MGVIRPGNFKITDRGLEHCNFSGGAKLLDIGCGRGETVEYLMKDKGYEACGIDLSLERIQEGKERNASLDLQYGDGEFLDGFSSFSFDGVLMECVLSLVNLPDEALHEAYCVLKKGGKLILSDLYMKDPEKELLKAVAFEAERQQNKPCKEGECEEEGHKSRAVDFRVNGVFLKEPLLRQLKEIGYRIVAFEDFSLELSNFVAEKILEKGGLDDCCCGEVLDKFDKKERKNIGYFLLVAEKPVS